MASRSGARDPWSVARRLERATSSVATTSLLSVASHDALGIVGFRPSGDVGGAYAAATGPHLGYGRCPQRDTQGEWIEEPRVITQRADRGFAAWLQGTFEPISFNDCVARFRKGWDAALERLLAECAALGGDGVVGVQLAEMQKGQHVLEFTALGTAVRSVGTTHLEKPLPTTLSGCDFAKLTGAGFFPAGVVVAIAVGLRHNDYETVSAKRSVLTNVEVPAHTELLNAAERATRDDMARRVAALGADGAIVDGQFAVRVREYECDYAAEVRLIANAVVRFRRSSPVGAIGINVDLLGGDRPVRLPPTDAQVVDGPGSVLNPVVS